MSIKKDQIMDTYLQKIAQYSTYVDCFSRLINEFIENGDDNIKPCDIPNLTEINSKLAFRLNQIIFNMKNDFEFMK